MEKYDADLIDLVRTWDETSPDQLRSDPDLMNRALSERSPFALVQQVLNKAAGSTLDAALGSATDRTLNESARIVAASHQPHLAHLLFGKAAQKETDPIKRGGMLLNFAMSAPTPSEAEPIFMEAIELGHSEGYSAWGQYLLNKGDSVRAEEVFKGGMEAGDERSFACLILMINEGAKGRLGRIGATIKTVGLCAKGALAGFDLRRGVREMALLLAPTTKERPVVNMPAHYENVLGQEAK